MEWGLEGGGLYSVERQKCQRDRGLDLVIEEQNSCTVRQEGL